MHVLVTGGAGFIGSHSVDCLLAAGARVRVLDNFSSGKMANLGGHQAGDPALEIIEGDVRDPAAVAAAMVGITHVLHLAAQVSVVVSVQLPVESASTNVTGFLNVLDSARRQGVRRFVYASSAAVYGLPAKLPLHEEDPALPISPYGLEKAIDDQYAALYRELYGTSAAGMRYFNVFGPRQDPSSQYSGVISIFAQRMKEGQDLTIYGDGGQTRDFIYVGDVARANVAALQSDMGGVCNVATGHTVSLLDLVATLADIEGRKPVVHFAEARSGDIRHSSAENHRLTQELGVTGFTSLKDGLLRLRQSIK